MQKADKTKGAEFITVRGLCFTLTQTPEFKRADLENLKAGIIELIDNLKLPISPIKNDYIVDYSSMVSTKFTCTIPIHLIRNILAGKLTTHRCQLLRYAIILLSTFESVEYKDLTAKMGKVSLNELAHMFRLSVAKTQVIIKELIDMRIICAYNRYLWFGLDADVRDLYALYEDMEQMEEYAKRKYDDKYVPVQESDKRRKLTQMYNAVQNGKEYDEQTMQYLYEYIKRQNTSHRREYYKRDLYWTHRRDHLAKVKSLKPFTKYKYLYKKKGD